MNTGDQLWHYDSRKDEKLRPSKCIIVWATLALDQYVMVERDSQQQRGWSNIGAEVQAVPLQCYW